MARILSSRATLARKQKHLASLQSSIAARRAATTPSQTAIDAIDALDSRITALTCSLRIKTEQCDQSRHAADLLESSLSKFRTQLDTLLDALVPPQQQQ